MTGDNPMLTAELFLAFLLALTCAMCARLVAHRVADLRSAQATQEIRLAQYVLGSELGVRK